MVSVAQGALWCGCGREEINSRGVCPTCARREKLSRENFNGLRGRVLARDGYARCCGETADLLVHHRRPGWNQSRLMITLCRRCHARIHSTLRPSYGFPEELLAFWREIHRDVPVQLRLSLVVPNGIEAPRFFQPSLIELGA